MSFNSWSSLPVSFTIFLALKIFGIDLEMITDTDKTICHFVGPLKIPHAGLSSDACIRAKSDDTNNMRQVILGGFFGPFTRTVTFIVLLD